MHESGSAVAALLAAATVRLTAAGVPSAAVDAELLAAWAAGIPRGRLRVLATLGDALDADARARFDGAVARREAREPLQHITGSAAFRGLELEVGPGVFVPRPETEQVAQIAIDLARAIPGDPLVVDLGTGSGAIAFAVAVEAPASRVVAVELSDQAIVWTRLNASRLGLPNVELVQADLAVALPELDGLVDLVVSNPPYIPLGAVPRDPEVRLHDPAAALYSGEDGLDAVRAVSRTAWRLVHPGGVVVIEHGDEQGGAVRAILDADGWSATATHADLTGRPRTTTGLR